MILKILIIPLILKRKKRKKDNKYYSNTDEDDYNGQDQLGLDRDDDAINIMTQNKSMIVVCGPHSLVAQASEMAFRYKCDFHTETFEL